MAMSDPTKPTTAADEARAWIERLVRFADECNARNKADPVSEENCPPTHVSAVVRLKPLPDGRVSVYEPGVEVTPDRLRAFLAEHDEQRDLAEKAERRIDDLNAMLALYVARFGNHVFSQADMVRAGELLISMDAELVRRLAGMTPAELLAWRVGR